MYDQFTSNKQCEFCNQDFEVKDIHNSARLCPECNAHKADIDAVRGETTYAQMTQEQKARVFDRVDEGRTVRRGGYYGFFNPKDPDGRLGLANEYRRKYRGDNANT